MSKNEFDGNRFFNEAETFSVTGRVLNNITKHIQNLNQQIQDMRDAAVRDELEALRIRDKNPTVRDAWDQYQTVLKLAQKE